jgi:hypothetical protein
MAARMLESSLRSSVVQHGMTMEMVVRPAFAISHPATAARAGHGFHEWLPFDR